MPLINPFETDAFNMVSLTQSINKMPNMYGRVQQLGLFSPVGVRTRTIIVEEMNGVLNLLPTMPVGAPGSAGVKGLRKVRSFVVPHIPHDDVVLPEESQGVRAFGSENELEGLAQLMEQKLRTMRNKHSITLEHLLIGALKGIILDADASTLFNLYTEFGISPETQDFVLSVDATDVRGAVLDVKRHIEDNLKGEYMTGVRCLCSQGWFDAFTNHPKVIDAYKYYQQNQNLSGDFRKGFTFADVTFEEYRGTATDAAGVARPFIAANQCHFFPEGTLDTFRVYFAPADFNETVNTIGIPLYAKQEPRKFGRGTDLHTQSNPLPMCARPEVLVKGTRS